jgi:hypothetical protein
VGIIIWQINKLIPTNMPCFYQRKILMSLDRWRFSLLWTYHLVAINYHWEKVRRSRWHFEELIFMGRTIRTNDNFFDLVSKTPLQISVGHELGVEIFQFHQILHWWNHCFQLNIQRSHASFTRGVWKTS